MTLEERYKAAKNTGRGISISQEECRRFMQLQAEIDGFWEHLHNAFEIESREELEKFAKGWKPPNPLVVALHHIWKREPKVAQLQAELDKHRWIPVEEGLPKEENIGYLIKIQHMCPFVATFGGDCFFDGIRGYNLESITHWKPIFLPEKFGHLSRACHPNITEKYYERY